MNTNTIKYDSLRDRILGQYSSMEYFADIVGMKLKDLNEKLDNKTEFVQEDIVRIRDAMHFSDDEIKIYFFPDIQPIDKENAMINLLSTRNIIKRLEQIEDGIEALDMMTAGQIKAVGDTISDEQFYGAFSFIMDKVKDSITDLRADLTGEYMKEYCRLDA